MPFRAPGPISADLMAKLEARVDKREKELDRRLDLEERGLSRAPGPVAGDAQAKEPMTPKELVRLRREVVDLERAAQADPSRAKELKAAQKVYEAADDEMKEQRKVRAKEIEKGRELGLGKGMGLGIGDDD